MSNTEAIPYSAEQIEAMDPACIAGCSKTHIESVICCLLATVRAALSSRPAHGGDVQAIVKDIHDAIAELAGVARYPDLTEAIDQLAALSSAPAQPVREPMSLEQRRDGYHAARSGEPGSLRIWGNVEFYYQGIQDAERHHGITKE